MKKPTNYKNSFDGLMSMINCLRGDNGCAWDRDQTRFSIKSHITGELYELLDALTNDDADEIIEELGDVIFHIAFLIHLCKEDKLFDERTVFNRLINKLTHRHPHVFGDEKISDLKEAEEVWNRQKQVEKDYSGMSPLDKIPKDLPSIPHALAIQKEVARDGFDWEEIQSVVDKVHEELDEFIESKSPLEKELEMGDILFSLVNLSRWLKIDADSALRQSNSRFRKRYQTMKGLSSKQGTPFESLKIKEKEMLWQKAKTILQNPDNSKHSTP